MRVLVTGGAGFIGSHVVDRLLADGHVVAVLDNLDPQIHPSGDWPDYLAKSDRLTLIPGDIVDDFDVGPAVREVKPEVVIHLAAKVGVGQSALDPRDYTLVNVAGTATLLEALQNVGCCKRLVVASSMSAYGEGLWEGSVRIRSRPEDERLYTPIGIPETEPFQTTSIYAETKATTERLALIWGEQRKIPTAALRFFNVFGERQAPTNPYTGVVAIFLSAALRGEAPTVYEDGFQARDFIDVRSVARVVCKMASGTATGPFNVGTGLKTSIREIAFAACEIAATLRPDEPRVYPRITGEHRAGDIRACIADIRKLLNAGINPRPFGESERWLLGSGSGGGMLDVARWMLGRDIVRVGNPDAELRAAGLIGGAS